MVTTNSAAYMNRQSNVLLSLLLFSLLIIWPAISTAANCTVSPYAGRASLNEFFKDQSNMSNDPDDFVEVKIMDPAIPSVIFDTWKIRICEDNDAGNNNDADGCSSNTSFNNYISVSNFTEDTIPWIVLKNGTIGRYINYKTGFDAVLLDANNNVIDYLSVDGYTQAQSDLGCTIANLPYDTTASAPGASDKFIFRNPDGTGEWDKAQSASAPPTEDNTNDTAPDGSTAPIISVNDVTVNKGQTAIFTFTLQGAPKSYDVSVEYETVGGTAIAGTDYTYTSGTVEIKAGNTTATVSVPTNAASTSGIVYFYLFLDKQQNATIANSYPKGTINANTSSEWRMDETLWSGTSNDVIDISSNNNHARAYNGLTTDAGYLCNAGNFDGSNDYLQIPNSSSLNGSSSLTYAAWIQPDTWSGGIRQVMAKSVHGGGSGRAQMGIFSESGVLKGRAETVAGRYEVTASLPPTGSWTHVAVVFNGYNLELYTNGSLTSVQFFSPTTLVQNSDPLVIGKRYGSNEYFFNGKIDEVIVSKNALPSTLIKSMYDNYQLGLNWDGTTRSCGLLHHYEIRHDGSALTCNSEDITVRACANSDCSTLYTNSSTVTLNTTPSGTAVTQTFTGSGTFQLRRTTAAAYTLGITSSSPAPSSSNVCVDTVAGNNSCVLTYHDTGFIYSVPDITACQNSVNFNIQAVRKDDTSQLCVPAFQNRTESINFWTTYSNPNTGTKQVRLTHNNVNTTLATSSPGTIVSLGFDNNAAATVTVYYEDAGEVVLNSAFSGTGIESGLSMTGSDTFVSRPATLYVYSDDANSDCTPASATCTAFRKTGQLFNLKVRAACNNGPTYTRTPNFRLNNVALTNTNVAPAVANGSLGVTSVNFDTAANGEVVINNQTLDEVGVFTITATAPNYFGLTIPASTSANIGRFTPDHFAISGVPALTNRSDIAGCLDTFTYMGQDFRIAYTLEAQNTSNAVTQNYTGTFAKLVPTAGVAAFNYGASSNNTDYTARLSTIHSAATTSFVNGSASITTTLQLARATVLDRPFNPLSIGIAANDGENTLMGTFDLSLNGGATTHTQLVNNADIRYGRFNIENAFGPQTLNLAMTAQAQYYDGTNFILNSNDNCTVMNSGLISFDQWTESLSIGDTQVLTINNPNLISGDAALVLQAPNSINTADDNNGSVRVTTNVPSYLQFDWDGVAGNENPVGIATFGIYRGDDRIIFWREVQN